MLVGIAVRLLTVAPLADGDQWKNCEVQFLNMTSTGKRHYKKSPEKIQILGPSEF